MSSSSERPISIEGIIEKTVLGKIRFHLSWVKNFGGQRKICGVDGNLMGRGRKYVLYMYLRLGVALVRRVEKGTDHTIP